MQQAQYSIRALPWTRKLIADRERKVIAVSAGLGSGKTHGAAQKHFTLCLVNKDSKFSAFVEPIYSKIHDTAIPTFRKVFDDIGLREERDFRVIKTPFPKIELLGLGQEIHFISGDRPHTIVGVEYSHGTIDEAGDQKEQVFLLLRSRLRCPNAVVRQLCIYGAPQGLNWFADTFDSETLPNWELVDDRDWILPERNFRRLRLRTTDNPFLPDDYIDSLYDTFGHNKNLIKSYIDGKFCALYEGNAYECYNAEAHDIEDIEPDPHADIALTFDFNANPLSYVALQLRTIDGVDGCRSKHWTGIHEAADGITNLEDAAVDFALKHPVEIFAETPIYLYGDSSGHAESHKTRETDYEALERYLRRLGYKRVYIEALKYNPLETVSVDTVNRWFAGDLLRICNRLTKLKRSLQATRWKEGKRKLDKPKGDDWTHPGDALKYFCYAKSDNEPKGVISVNA